MTRRNIAVLIAAAGILVYQLMIPPVVGLADQGDYARLLGPFHLGPVAQRPYDRYYGYFNRTYQHDPNFKIPGWEIYSSQDIFVGAAILLNKWISKDGLLDIRVLAFLEMLVFLAICYFLLLATAKLLPGREHYLIAAALIVIFCDAGYICYFNSFYSEPATYLSLLALLAVWLDWIANGPADAKHFALFTLCALLFVTAKPQNVPVGIILAVYLLRFRKFLQPRWMAPAASVILLAASLVMYWTVPRPVRLAQIYNMIFMEMAPQSPSPAAELGELGLDPAYARYSGSTAFIPDTAFWNPAFQDQLDARVSRAAIVWHYLRRPAKFLNYVRGVLPRGTSLRPVGVGNFEKSAGYPPVSHARSFAVWSRFHEHYLALWSSGVLIGLMLAVPLAGWIAARARDLRARLVAECYAVLALAAVAVFFTTILGDAHDIVKHLHLYNVLTDICLVFAAAVVLSRITTARRVSSRSKFRFESVTKGG